VFGYVVPSRARLDERENERFRAVYCGLCHTLGRRYGFAARFLLNYDFTFLAILLSPPDEPVCAACRCVVHLLRSRCTMCAAPALDLAADRCVVLSWWQLQDHIADHGFFAGLKYRAASWLLARAYRKARVAAPEFDGAVRRHLRELAAREEERCSSLDAAAEPFAALLADTADCVADGSRRRVLRQLFYHLGRWIYLIDAADDFAKDAKSGCYNPLRYRYGAEEDKLSDENKRALAQTLDASIRQMAAAYALCDCGVWTPILDSIFYESFYGIGKAVLEGTYRKPLPRAKRTERGKQEETP